VVWTAGSKTWRQLARQGVWVNGCAEGLGESEDPRLEDLVPGLRWLRFSHDQSTPPLRGEAVATYRLIAKDKVEPLPEADEYVWSNALVAEEAMRRWPWLEKKRHFCGPGKTFALLTKIFPGVQKIWQSEELT
jgi:hydroxymethylbilane synthase